MSTAVDDALWSAVGDPTRRRLLDLLLAQDGASATTLATHLPVTRQAVAKHLVVLDRAGLVHTVSAGREKRYRVDPSRLSHAVSQLEDVGAAWDRRLRRIKEIAEAIEQKNRKD
jgi:DNA-binding transcriptional ArsR family regulator